MYFIIFQNRRALYVSLFSLYGCQLLKGVRLPVGAPMHFPWHSLHSPHSDNMQSVEHDFKQESSSCKSKICFCFWFNGQDLTTVSLKHFSCGSYPMLLVEMAWISLLVSMRKCEVESFDGISVECELLFTVAQLTFLLATPIPHLAPLNWTRNINAILAHEVLDITIF